MRKTMRKSALLSSIAMLIVSAIVLTSATYAWFSSSKVVYVEQLDAGVTVTTGLLINIEKDLEEGWKTQVNFEDAVAVKDGWGKGFDKDMIFDPVSTEDGTNWITAVYEEKDGVASLNSTAAVPGVKDDGTFGSFVAVPLWVTGPVGAEVAAKVKFDGTTANSATLRCLKFALVPANEAGDAVASGAYEKAVAAEANADNKFVGISTPGTPAATGAYVSSGGKEIAEVAADGTDTTGIHFTIEAGTSTEKPMKFIAFLWLEGNDADCDMLKFSPSGEDIGFNMTLNIVKDAPAAA